MTFDHEHINKNKFSDSAGTPWAGRAFDVNNFSGDDGSAPAALLAALTAFHAREVDAEVVIDAIRESRLLIPLLAEVAESEVGAHGLKTDKSADLSIVTVATPDDQNGLPVSVRLQQCSGGTQPLGRCPLMLAVSRSRLSQKTTRE
jgi:hypothetical protein